jgi:hypothetical protein
MSRIGYFIIGRRRRRNISQRRIGKGKRREYGGDFLEWKRMNSHV